MILVDTSYLVALLDRRDALHARAAAWAASLATEQFLVTEYVLWETVNFASRPPYRSQIHPIIAERNRSPAFRVVEATGPLFEEGMALHQQRPDQEWSLTDCISFLTMDRYQVRQALTHDHHFEQAGFEALLRRDPSR